jgi:two-component system cell cycle response regulator
MPRQPGMQSTIRTDPLKPTSASKDACLVYIYPPGPDMGKRHTLNNQAIILGRDPECEIHVADSAVSRRHVSLTPDAEGYAAEDLNSTNGTYINDQLIRLARLVDGDYLRIGSSIFRFLSGGNIEADYHQVIYELTIRDALTEVHNKKFLIDFLDRELVRSARHNRPLSVVMLDIDHFKKINDTRGHLCGDHALRELSARIKATIRRDELFARFGGEEFTIVLPETPRDGAIQVAERVRLLIADQPFAFDGELFDVTISLGVATTMGDEGMTSAGLLDLADQNLYQAKKEGRNRVAY